MKLKSNYPYYILWSTTIGLLLYTLGFAIWTIMATETGNGDNVEHLHATWLVANGSVVTGGLSPCELKKSSLPLRSRLPMLRLRLVAFGIPHSMVL